MAQIKLIMGTFSKKTYTDKRGYKRFTDSNTPVHRWAAEKKIGRKLKEGEVVHHKDRNKQNNSPSNLHIFKSQIEHDKAHKKDARRYGKAFSYKGKKSK
jgi:hypothetical protein